jgi:Holliday junction resolvase
MKESTIERAVCAYAKAQGCLVLKLAGPNQKGQPDRMFIKSGQVLFIEFKAPGKLPTKLQEKWIKDLRLENMPAFCCDSIQDGKILIDIVCGQHNPL